MLNGATQAYGGENSKWNYHGNALMLSDSKTSHMKKFVILTAVMHSLGKIHVTVNHESINQI